MAYYLRVLSPSTDPVPASSIRGFLEARVVGASMSVTGGEDSWDQLVLAHKNGPEIAVVERNPVDEGQVGADEISEFLEELEDGQPRSGADWLVEYLPTVRTIYAVQVLDGAYRANGWEIIGAVREALLSFAGGITQADGEGFSNEDGYHILWQFSESATGTWWMAVRRGDTWIRFEMDLGNPSHRASFMRGEIPEGVKVAE